MKTRRLAVIGAGPKAAALAANAHIQRALRRKDVEVTIFERAEIGANWTGRHGYTDGAARLCTPAERDLGFPYAIGLHDRDVAARMYADFSWGAYLVAAPRSGGREGFGGWVDRGRMPPSHADYARYLEWAIGRSDAKIEYAEVTALERATDGWKVRRVAAGGARSTNGIYDGVVLTGPGPAIRRVEVEGSSNRITDGQQFWRDPAGFLANGKGSDDPIVIIGAGGTAAAIAARLMREGATQDIVIVGDQAALFTRSETFFESQLFSDDETWRQLDPKIRASFTTRLNRGVVWATISEELSRSRNVRFEPGRAQKIVCVGTDPDVDLTVGFRNGGGERRLDAALVVDASGFDAWWFSKILPVDLRDRIEDPDTDKQRAKQEALRDAMGEHLDMFDDPAGPIHAPMLSHAVGPGYSTLMVLGAMSARILSRY